MKNLLRAAALCCGSLLLTTAFAQQGGAAAPATQTQAPVAKDGWNWLDLGAYQKHLGLNATEMGALKDIENKYSNLRRELDPALTIEERTAKVVELMKAREDEVFGALTKDQQKKWKELHTTKASTVK